MADDANGKRVTLDGQLVRYWEREAARLEDQAGRTLFKWIARGHRRKAARARAMAEQSRRREAARGHAQGTVQGTVREPG